MIYSVKSGDSLSKIARDVLGNMALWPEIARLNSISAPYVISPGQQLMLPSASTPAAAPSATTSPAPIVQQPTKAAAARPVAPGAGFNIMDFLQRNYLLVAGGISAIVLLGFMSPKRTIDTKKSKSKRRN